MTWDNGGIRVNLLKYVTVPPAEPPETFWTEWSFASNQAFAGDEFCDGTFIVLFKDVGEIFHMFGDAATTFGAIELLGGLEINEFHTYRFESADGLNWCLFVDGRTLHCETVAYPDDRGTHFIQISGGGGCTLDSQPTFNRYDFVRYGTLSDGEVVVATSPPAGAVGSADFENLDRFTIRYNLPAYVRIDQIAVSVSGGDVPTVIKTRRPLNADPQTIEIVLDRPMAIGETTSFTISDGLATNIIPFTVSSTGACCREDAVCTVTDPDTCQSQGGAFTESAQCGEIAACCFSSGGCEELTAHCCSESGGSPISSAPFCEGDADGDGFDGVCGDVCPDDPFKLFQGVCGCGSPDIDSDSDTVLDCNDQCDGRDDRVDQDANGVPDCVEFFPIPTVSTWGLAVLTLLLAITAKLAFRRTRYQRV